MAASNNGRTDAVAQLLEDGADPNMQDHVSSYLLFNIALLKYILTPYNRLVGQPCWQLCTKVTKIFL